MEAWFEGLVLALAAVPVLRVLVKRPIRRELQAHPLLAIVLLVGGLLALAFLVWLSISFELARRLVVVAVALGGLAAFVHARPGYGSARGLPPGSLGLATSLEAIDDPGFYAKAAERWGPIFKMRQIHRPVVCITDLPAGLELLRTHDDALVQSDWSFNRLVPGGYLEFMNGETHTRYRGVFAAAFTRDVVEPWQESRTMIVRQQLAQMARSQGRDGVAPEPFLLPIPLTSLLGTVLGVSPGGDSFDRLTALLVELNRPMELFLPLPRSKQDTWRELTSAVIELANMSIHQSPGAPSSASVLAHLVQADPRLAADDTVIGNLVLMVKEGGIMVRGLLRWILKMLAEDEQRARQFRDAGADDAQLDARAAAFVHETIRLYESRYVYRHVARDVKIRDYTIPKGWLLRLCLGEAHERADRFPEPKRFDPARFTETLPDRRCFCPFGDGRHACLGDATTLAIAKTFVREAAVAYDLRIVRDGDAWRINRHWGLWRPSNELRIAMSLAIGSTSGTGGTSD